MDADLSKYNTKKADLSDLFKKHLANLQKGVHVTKTFQDRKQEFLKDRKCKRETLTFARRNIDLNMSPYRTPVPAQRVSVKEEKKEAPKKQSELAKKRLELLAKWKREKEKQKQLEKANKKPIFKVCHIETNLAVNLETVNKLIKGKPFVSSAKKSQFAPANHKFKPPNGIKPLNFTTITAQSKVLETSSKNMTPIFSRPGSTKVKLQRERDDSKNQWKNHKTPLGVQHKQPVRSSTRIKEKNSLIKSASANVLNGIREIKGKSVSTSKTSSAKIILTSKGISRQQEGSRKTPINIAGEKPKQKTDVNVNENNIRATSEVKFTPVGSSTRTPKRISSSCPIKPATVTTGVDVNVKSEAQHIPVYISPFVTISRGKRNAQEEYRVRHSYGNELQSLTPEKVDLFTRHTSPEAGADYFMVKLDSEIDRLNKMCQQWEDYRRNPELPEESCSSIDVAIGQCKLLIAKKFEQFRGLIVQCKTKQYEEKTITCEDLHGFWDMVYMQVEDLEKRFANLERLRASNWIEMLPEKKAQAKKAKTRGKQTKTSSRLKNMIKAAREKQKNENNNQMGDVETRTPLKEQPIPQVPARSSTNRKNNLRISVLQKNRCSSSPGLTIMKVSQSIKQGNGLTPAKSILKTDGSISTGKKSVAFKESPRPKNFRKTLVFDDGDDTTDQNKENTPQLVRRSSRLAKTSA